VGGLQAVTLVFTDLVGSTALASSLDPDVADAVRQAHFASLRTAVAANDGREVKNLGDGLMCVFATPSQALAGAVAMQQAVARDNRRTERALAIRVGVATGEVTEEDGDYFGDAVVEAARLCAAASPDEILATDVVRLLAGRRAGVEFRAVGDLELKGLPEPVATVAVAWHPLDDGTGPQPALVPLPARLVGRGAFGFVGRRHEQVTIAEARADAAAGRRRVVVVAIAGEPGIGKSRLAAEAAAVAWEGGDVVLHGACDEELAVPYRPWREALRHLIAHVGDDVLAAVGRRRLADLARVLPEIAERVPDLPDPVRSDAETERYLFYGAASALLAATTEVAPVLLVFDDLHWADRPSLALLRHVVTAADVTRLVVLATYRPAEVDAGTPVSDLITSLHRDPGVDRISLWGLGDEEIVALVEAAAGHPLGSGAADLARALTRETGGNPFFAGEVLRHLAESGLGSRDGLGRWTAVDPDVEIRLPESVREVVTQRVARLGPTSESVLAMAAVAGATFDLDDVAAAAGVEAEEALAVLEQALRAGLLHDEAVDTFAFAHALIQHTLYEQLGPTRRARAHRRLADVIEARAPARAGEIARHLGAAGAPSDLARAVRHAAEAGRQAMASLAPQDAVHWYALALEFGAAGPSDDAQRCALLCELATAQLAAGDPELRGTALAAARLADELGDTERLVRAALTDPFHASIVHDPDRIVVLEAALEAIGPDRVVDRVRLLAQLSRHLYFRDAARARVLHDEAWEVAERAGDATAVMAIAGVAPNGDPRSLYLHGEAHQRAVAAVGGGIDPGSLFPACYHLIGYAFAIADLEQLDAALARAMAIADQLGRPDFRYVATGASSDRALLVGDVETAERLAAEAYELGQSTGVAGAFVLHVARLADIRWHQGRSHEMTGLLAEAAASEPDVPILHLPGGEAGMADGRTLVEAVEQLPIAGGWLSAMEILAERAARAGDVAACRAARAALLPYAEMFARDVAPPSRGPVAFALGVLERALGDQEAADEWFGRSLAQCEAMRAPFFRARTEIEQARLLLDRQGDGDAARARELLLDARAIGSRHGYEALTRRAARLLD
jgi:class 3 adenylate cyclase/tetratricopeptide (TPR) repeat protein